MIFKKQRNKQKGFGLLELMLSMVIIALLLIMATRYYQSAQRTAHVNAAVQSVGEIIAAANQYAATNTTTTPGYSGITMTSIAPYLAGTQGTTYSDGWVGVIDFSGSPTASTFALVINTGSDQAGCTQLMNALNSAIKTLTPATCTGTAVNFTYNS